MPLAAQVTAPLFQSRKGRHPLVVVTAYDAPQGRLADGAGVDAILVGDSVGMTTLGYETTLPVTLDDMVLHTRAVARGMASTTADKNSEEDAARGARHALLISDLPFGSYGITIEEGVRAGLRLVQEGGAAAVKMEGAGPIIEETTRRLISLGVPVMGHLGMTPQSVHRFGGFRLQGKTEEAGRVILRSAQALAEAGVFAIVLELIPSDLSRQITERIPAVTIGIGAGPHCDGQVQVLHDVLGLTDGKLPRHAHRYADLSSTIQQAIRAYASDVRAGRFPAPENSF